MKILILGGTVFLGRHIVDAARARGHELTLFNRGQQNADLFPDLEKLRGDRNGDMAALRGRHFDVVIDTSGYTPKHVSAASEALGGRFDHYTFISSISAYREFPPGVPFDEDAPLAGGVPAGYGPLKAYAERALEALAPGRAAHLRAGLIVGPHDPTDRFTYWPRRVARGGLVLAPGRPDRPIQIIDVRDLAEWCVGVAEARITGPFNAVGPQATLTMARLLEVCRTVTGSDARFTWIADDDLVEARVQPWTELPLWIPEEDEHFGGMMLADNRRACAAGLEFRSLEDTVRSTLDWDRRDAQTAVESSARVTTISAEREMELLQQP